MANVLNEVQLTMTQELVAEKLLWPLWRAIDPDFKQKYARDVWGQFENAIRSSAYTSNMKVFLANMQQRLPIVIGRDYIQDVLSVVGSGCDDQILDDLRDETTYMVLLVRLRNEEQTKI
jgi:hypothetical protein